MSTPATSWLCPNPGDRDRLADMDRRLKPQRVRALGFLAFALIVAAILDRVGADVAVDRRRGTLDRHGAAGVGLVVLDLDHCKVIHDDHGHEVGDAVRPEVACRIRKELRAYDLAYRLGGEEFLVVLPGADVEDAASIAEKLRVAIEQTAGSVPAFSASFGVSASLPGNHEAVFEAADRALYEAKAAGRNTARASRQDSAADVTAVA